MLTVNKKNYVLKTYDEEIVKYLIQRYKLKEIQARLIAIRNLEKDIENFLNPKIKNLMPNPSLIKGVDKATDIIISAIKNLDKILIWGDYDVDGICSVSVIANYLNVINVDYDIHIPNRFNDGYGVKIDGVKRLKSLDKYDLIIMVDCGSNDNESIDYLKSLNKKIIIIDHHIIKSDIPFIDAFVNNKQPDDILETKDLCACGMVFMVMVSVNRKIQKLLPEKEQINMMRFIDLVAIATICDIVPLIGLNRAFVKTGLSILNRTENQGLIALRNQLGVKNITSFDIGFKFGPSLNAAGRLEDALLASTLLNSKTESDEILFKCEAIVQLNSLRKTISYNVVKEALEQAKLKSNNNFILLWGDNWHEGIIGIVANKIKETYQKPCCIVSFENSDIGKGSGRSTDEFDLGKAILSANEFLVHGGGHKKAVGFSVEKNKIHELEEYLIEYAKDLKPSCDVPIDAVLSLDAINIDFYKDVMSLEPFGECNPEPIFKIDNIFITKIKPMGEKHISCIIKSENNNEKSGLSFNVIDTDLYNTYQQIQENQRYSIVGRLIKNDWSSKIGFVISDII